MEDASKKFIFKNGLRFEVTPDGLFYAPEEFPADKKHPCPDCKFCQWCAVSRCNLCRPQEEHSSARKKGTDEFKMV
jgi:hypothetical protein